MLAWERNCWNDGVLKSTLTASSSAPHSYMLRTPQAAGGEETDPGTTRASTVAKGRPARHRVKHRRQKQGQTIFKGHPSWAIMNGIKLGVHYTVSRAESATLVEASRPLTLRDFTTEFRHSFPPEGSPQTQAHSSEEFTFRDAAPLAFRHVREHFGVSAEDYMVSICGENNLRELGTPGKSVRCSGWLYSCL